jgi:CMP-N-acetylneuraminic acid synthetase
MLHSEWARPPRLTSHMMIAVIPARGGSKRLPKKNILPFAGRPLICHSITLARSLRVIDRVCVSTDDPETARIARDAGAEIVMRPPELATDRSTTASAIRHALATLAESGPAADAVITLQPNCPLRTAAIVDDAVALFRGEKPDSVVSVTKSHHKLGPIENGRFLPAYRPGMRSQDLADQYFENGVIYVSRADLVMNAEDLFGSHIAPLIIDPLYALGDIDTLLDFQVAEFLFTKYRERFVPSGDLPAQGAA